MLACRTSLTAVVAFGLCGLLAPGAAPGEPRWQYAADFEGSVGPEWSKTATARTPWGARAFLGQLGAESVTLTLPALPAHGYFTVEFDLFIIGSWDGNYVSPSAGPDIWELRAEGGPIALHTTFNTHTFAAQYQAYPDAYPGGQHPSNTGAEEVNTLGYSCVGSCTDAVYHMSFAIDHHDPSLALVFTGAGLEAISNESWGLDNVKIWIEGTPSDFDHDWDVDLADFEALRICFNGPNRPPALYCPLDSDLDDDGDVDLGDFMIFQSCFNGPNRPPACL